MDFFFKPKGVAVVGASANPNKGGHFILNNVMKGFRPELSCEDKVRHFGMLIMVWSLLPLESDPHTPSNT